MEMTNDNRLLYINHTLKDLFKELEISNFIDSSIIYDYIKKEIKVTYTYPKNFLFDRLNNSNYLHDITEEYIQDEIRNIELIDSDAYCYLKITESIIILLIDPKDMFMFDSACQKYIRNINIDYILKSFE